MNLSSEFSSRTFSYSAFSHLPASQEAPSVSVSSLTAKSDCVEIAHQAERHCLHSAQLEKKLIETAKKAPVKSSLSFDHLSIQEFRRLGLMYQASCFADESGDLPPGEFDEIACLMGDAPYVKQELSEKWEKKEIVVQQLGLSVDPSSLDAFHVECILLGLFQAGFRVWLVTNTGLVQLTCDQDFFNCLKKADLKTTQELIELASAHRIGQDALLCIDYKSIGALYKQLHDVANKSSIAICHFADHAQFLGKPFDHHAIQRLKIYPKFFETLQQCSEIDLFIDLKKINIQDVLSYAAYLPQRLHLCVQTEKSQKSIQQLLAALIPNTVVSLEVQGICLSDLQFLSEQKNLHTLVIHDGCSTKHHNDLARVFSKGQLSVLEISCPYSLEFLQEAKEVLDPENGKLVVVVTSVKIAWDAKTVDVLQEIFKQVPQIEFSYMTSNKYEKNESTLCQMLGFTQVQSDTIVHVDTRTKTIKTRELSGSSLIALLNAPYLQSRSGYTFYVDLVSIDQSKLQQVVQAIPSEVTVCVDEVRMISSLMQFVTPSNAQLREEFFQKVVPSKVHYSFSKDTSNQFPCESAQEICVQSLSGVRLKEFKNEGPFIPLDSVDCEKCVLSFTSSYPEEVSVQAKSVLHLQDAKAHVVKASAPKVYVSTNLPKKLILDDSVKFLKASWTARDFESTIKAGKSLSQLSLSVSFDSDEMGASCYCGGCENSVYEQLLNSVRKMAPQLQELSLSIEFDEKQSYVYFFDELAAMEFPRLTSLRLLGDSDCQSDIDNEALTLLLAGCPNLCDLELKNIDVVCDDVVSPDETVFLESLTSLSAVNVTGRSDLFLDQIFLSAPNISKIDLDLDQSYTPKMNIAHLALARICYANEHEITLWLDRCPNLLVMRTCACISNLNFKKNNCHLLSDEDAAPNPEIRSFSFSYNTGEIQYSYVAKKIFEKFRPRDHRAHLSTVQWHEGKILCSPVIHQTSVIPWPSSECVPDDTGSDSLLLSHSWSAITGLSCADTLCQASVVGVLREDVEWGYDKEHRQYFIRLKDDDKRIVTLEYAIQTQKQTQKAALQKKHPIITIDKHGICTYTSAYKKPSNDRRLQELVGFFQSFTVGDPEYPKGSFEWQKLNQILEKRCGIACSGRAQLFCLIAPQILPQVKKAFYVHNAIHAYVEVEFTDGSRTNFDLGGYPADVTITTGVSVGVVPEVSKSQDLMQRHPRPVLARSSQAFCKGFDKKVVYEDLDHFANAFLSSLLRYPKTRKQGLLVIDESELSPLHNAFFSLAPLHEVASLDIKRRRYWMPKRQDNSLSRSSNSTQHVIKHGGILLVDLTELNQANISALLSITDPTSRKIDKMPVHEDVSIIAFIKKDARLSNDIVRRFSIVSEVPKLPFKRMYGVDSCALQDLELVDLFDDSTSWYRTLVASIDAKNGIKEGAIVHALTNSKPGLVISNPPEDRRFAVFIQSLARGYVEYDGERIKVPKEFQIHFSKTPPKKRKCSIYSGCSVQDAVLNPVTFRNFFPQVQIFDKDLSRAKGLVEAHSGKTLNVLVTHPLSSFQWQRLFDEVDRHKAVISLQVTDSTIVTDSINAEWHKPLPPMPGVESRLIASCDLAYSQMLLQRKMPHARVVQISEQTRSSMLLPYCKKAQDSTNFEEVHPQVWKDLVAGDDVIAVGAMSEQLLLQLSTLLCSSKPYYFVNGVKHEVAGKLYVITSSKEILRTFPHTVDEPTHDEQKSLLETSFTALEIQISQKLLAACKITPTVSNIKALCRYRARGIENPVSSFTTSAHDAVTYANRFETVIHFWHETPLVFIYGPPACGKTHFMYHMLPEKMTEFKFYFSVNQMRAFLQDAADSVLCIDEADLDASVIEPLLGLYADPRCVLLDGTPIYPKGKKLVVLALNAHFSGRKELSCIREYGGACYFAALNEHTLRNNVLNPLLEMNAHAKAFVDELLQQYRKRLLGKCEVDVRDLKMMCAQYKIWNSIAKNYCPRELASACFCHVCDEAPTELLREIHEAHAALFSNQALYITKERRPVVSKILSHLEMREQNSTGAKHGIILEGPAGEGKTVLVQHILKSFGYQRLASLDADAIDTSREYLELNVSDDDPEAVRAALHRAFHEGLIVVSDDFDGKYEPECGAYLLGVDLFGKPANKSGFWLFATANGAAYPYRTARSESLDSRLQRVKIVPYTDSDLDEILRFMQIEDAMRKKLLQEHVEKREYAPCEMLKPTAAELIESALQSKEQYDLLD